MKSLAKFPGQGAAQLRKFQKRCRKFLYKCIFVALNHSDKKYRKQVFTRIGAFILLILFTTALLVQALHKHDQDTTDHCKTKSEQLQSPIQIKVSKLSCKLCEVIKHQSHHYLLPIAIKTSLITVQPTDRQVGDFGKHPDAYILSAANKGPPNGIA